MSRAMSMCQRVSPPTHRRTPEKGDLDQMKELLADHRAEMQALLADHRVQVNSMLQEILDEVRVLPGGSVAREASNHFLTSAEKMKESSKPD